MPNPLEPLVVTATLRLSKVTKVPAPTKSEVNPAIPVPLVPLDPEVPLVPEVPLNPDVPDVPEVPLIKGE